ncbi:MAG: type II secretion system F family protein [Actinomycetia bacterium]|nr:type II secretion system F family protein [Actinomycetes bacterium]
MSFELVPASDALLVGAGLLGLVGAGRSLGWWEPVRSGPRGDRSGALTGLSERWAGVDRRLFRLGSWAVGAAVVVGVLGVVSPLLGVIVPVLVGALGWRRRRAQQQRELSRAIADLPEVADLLAVAASAGLTPHAMLDLLADLLPNNAVVNTLAEARTRAARGGRLADELEALALTQPRLGSLTSALGGAERFGAPLEPALVMVARDARTGRRRQVEEQARRLPVRLLFPLIVCVLPAFVLLTVVPVLVATVGDLVG